MNNINYDTEVSNAGYTYMNPFTGKYHISSDGYEAPIFRFSHSPYLYYYLDENGKMRYLRDYMAN